MLRETLECYEDGAIEEGDLAAIGLALEQFHNAVADRRIDDRRRRVRPSRACVRCEEAQGRAAAMGIETEIKFEVSPSDLQKLAASRSLRPSNGNSSRTGIWSPPISTPPNMLSSATAYRFACGRPARSISRPSRPHPTASPSSRGEWEKRIDGNEPDLRAARGTPLQRLLSKRLRRDLDAVFATHVHRTLVPLRPGNSRVELALDEGHIRAGLYSTPLAEVELELKSGSIGDLFKTARTVAQLVPARLALKTKSEQGYDLIADQPTAAVSGSRIELAAQGNARYSVPGDRPLGAAPRRRQRTGGARRSCPKVSIRCGSACGACALRSGCFPS